MELLLLFIIGIVISKYIGKKSRVAAIANAVVVIIFSILLFYSSDNATLVYLARNTMSESAYNILHSALRNPFIFIRWGYSSYISIVFFITFFFIAVSTMFTVQTIKKYFSEEEVVRYNDDRKKKLKFLRYEQKISKDKLYLVFGGFLS